MDKKNLTIFLAVIILAGIIIATAIVLIRMPYEIPAPNSENTEDVVEPYAIQDVTENDHILGSPNADVILVEYADFRCPYCQEFQPTMNRMIGEYGKTGQFAWVYRHFPSADALNNNPGAEKSLSYKAALASECVADLLGNTAFFEFTNGIFFELGSEYTEESLRSLAIDMGALEEEYDACIIEDRYKDKITRDIKDGLSIYENDPNFGTPYNIVIAKSGFQTEIIGAQPYELIETIVQQYSFPDRF
jgi:protein-disulfide isomerase